jgi:hypothetical protein
MLRSVKYIIWMLALAAGAQSAFGYALIGTTAVANTSDAYQTQALTYNVGNSEDGMPKSIHEESRRTMPVVYVSVDQSFWEYFNTNGVDALEQAFAMYNRVGKTSQVDPNDYPEDSRRPNFRAQALSLYDLKSVIMGTMTTQVGLFEPTRWVWALTGRQLPNPPTCPVGVLYTIIQRNYSLTPVGTDTYPTTSYVNGVLYSYFISEACTGTVLADAVEFPVDPLSQPYSAVADFGSQNYAGLLPGVFYTSLTRDDVAGLKYLYATNNINNEAAGRQVTEFVTNDVAQAQVVTTQDLGALAAAAKTSTAAQLQAQFPGLQVLSTSNYFGFQITTNITIVLVNSPIDPAGAPASHPIISTNFTTNVVQFFTHTFGNIVTNTYATRGIVGTVTQTITNSPFAPAGFPPTTNTVVKLTPQTGVFGDFFILPTNTCGALILSNMLTTVTPTTNLPVVTSNAPAGGPVTITFTPGSVTFPTNHTLIYLPVTCPVNAIAQRGGTDRIQFVMRFYDSLTSRFWDPITNNYTLTEFNETNGTISLRHFQRRVPRPDILFTTADFSSVNTTINYSNTVDNVTETFTLTVTGVGSALGFHTGPFFDVTGRTGNKAGPATITDDNQLPTLYILNRQYPVFQNTQVSGTVFITEAGQLPISAWGSFDGTTNAPVVYPNGSTLTELEDFLLGPAPATPTLPDGNIGLPYFVQLAGKSGTAPYTWSLAPNSPALPDGLNISSDGQITGVPSGPAAIYDFTVRITDSAGKFRDVQYTITIF